MKKPKILFFDIETAPNLGYTWGKFDQDVIQFKEEWSMLSFSWKWQGSSKVGCFSLRDFTGKNREKQLVRALHSLLNKSDISVAHNGDSFDNRKSKTRMALHGLNPISLRATIDTLKVYKKHFHLNSYSLGAIADYFDFDNRKTKDTNISLWLGCMNDDPSSWDKMEKYNKQDVRVLEEAYEFALPWMHSHPNIALLKDHKGGCPKCGSKKVQKRGLRANSQSVQQQWQCQSCKGWFVTRRVK